MISTPQYFEGCLWGRCPFEASSYQDQAREYPCPLIGTWYSDHPNRERRHIYPPEYSPQEHASLQQRVGALGYPMDIEVEAFIDPSDWESQGMERGTPFALSHRFRQTGPFRPNNVTKHAPGLVFTGSGTLPGVGVPMVLVSGKLAAERVDQL